MPFLTDLLEVRRLLETDRRWAVYALGDLAPHRLPHCSWLHAPAYGPGLALLYREFGTPVLLALGPPDAVRPLVPELVAEPRMFIHLPPDLLELLRPHYRVEEEADMWRMILDPTQFASQNSGHVHLLGSGDVTALERLFADGKPTGEVPHFYFPAMLDDGAFFGIWEGNDLIAAGGTHMVEPALDLAAIGNIYTRRDRRGRGFARRVTCAITAELLRRGLGTIALNVNQHNGAAIHVYESLGFQRYCPFKEGLAVRK